MELAGKRIERRKGWTMLDFQKTLLIAAATAILTMFLNSLFTLPRFEERTSLNYEAVAKSIDHYNSTMVILTSSVNKMQTDVEVMKNNIEFVKEIANTKVKTLEGRLTALEYRSSDKISGQY